MNHLEDFGNAPSWGDYLRLSNELTVVKMELELLKGRLAEGEPICADCLLLGGVVARQGAMLLKLEARVAEMEAQRRIPRPRIKMPPPGPSSIIVRGANPLPPPKDVSNQ